MVILELIIKFKTPKDNDGYMIVIGEYHRSECLVIVNDAKPRS